MAEGNAYELLGLENRDATAQEIRTAYRQRSLKVHPDRNPSPEAAVLFNALFEAYELLKDPSKRAKLDQELNAKAARAQRFSALDNKRKSQMADLEEREEAFKRSREEEQTKERQQAMKLQRLKEEGLQLRREKDHQEKQRREAVLAASQHLQKQDTGVHKLNANDTTLRIKWQRASLPNYTTEDDIRALLSPHLTSPEDIDTLIVSTKAKANPAKNKTGTAIVSLKTLNATIHLVKAAEQGKLGQGIEIKWVSGKVPQLAKAAMGLMEVEENDANATASITKSAPAPPTAASTNLPPPNEADVLAKMRARQEERRKLEEEIRRQDAADED